jgi:hypothetical protein
VEDHFVGAKKVEDADDRPYTEGRFVSLGEGDKKIPSVEGLLLGIEESHTYPGNLIYLLGTKTEVLKVAGNTFLKDKIKDVGALYRITFAGMARSKSGRMYKSFEILTVDAATVREKGLAKDYKSLGGDAEGDDLAF